MDQFKYLVKLRNSGKTNMLGAGPYLARQFMLSPSEADTVLGEWIKSFELSEDEQPKDGR